MNIITIPKKIAQKGDLIVISRREYETLVRRQPKVISVVNLTPAEKRAIAQSEKELVRGDYITLAQLEYELGGANSKKR